MKRLWDIWWNQWTIWPKVISIIGLLLLIGLLIGGIRSCGKKKDIKVDHDAIQKVNSENRAEVKKEVREIVSENLEVVTTVDQRTTLAEANAVERDRLIEEKIRHVDQKVEAAKNQGRDVTEEELECMLVPANCG